MDVETKCPHCPSIFVGDANEGDTDTLFARILRSHGASHCREITFELHRRGRPRDYVGSAVADRTSIAIMMKLRATTAR